MTAQQLVNLRPMTAKQAARRLGCSVNTVHRLIHNGTLPAEAKAPGLRGAFLINPADVDALAEKRATPEGVTR